MDRNQEYLAHGSGEIEQGEHPRGCLCTSCTTELLLENGFHGRYDRNVVRPLHHLMELRERVPVSAGDGE